MQPKALPSADAKFPIAAENVSVKQGGASMAAYASATGMPLAAPPGYAADARRGAFSLVAGILV